MCNIFPRQTFFPLTLGAVLSTLGLAVISYAISTENTSLLSGMMVVTGAGIGLRLVPSSLHTVGVWPERIAPAMSLMQVSLPFGGTIGLTIMTSVFNNKFGDSAAVQGLGDGGTPLNVHDQSSLSMLDGLSAAAQEAIRAAGKDAIMWAFIAILPIMGVSLLTGLIMGNVWVNVVEDGGEARSEVIHVPYLWAVAKVSPSPRCAYGKRNYSYSTQGNLKSYKQTSKPR